ncbi:sensor histidine kinase [Subtercola boreus]|uniref:histidine kinase n=1 Tax=Subtercola boreus TaxID=120213 RepID=A0A3E0W9J7_9MICO|nr:sensor histidine kinase [Subtercola boreus]RFA19060.1 hypothetical protein B7R24_13090 [Subtercola boreus]RFA19198.1 hypothetical protein B7R23_13070 [Subtercola boreus]RFA25660.1 hypothetical protein B7R25_13190 [Subtercola boreus]
MAESTPTAGAWQRQRPSPAALGRDAAVAAVLVVATVGSAFVYASITSFTPPAWWVSALWAVVIAAPLAFRRRLPAVVALVVAAAFVAGQLLFVPEVLFSNICLFVALYSLGAWGVNRTVAKLVRLAIIVGMFLWLFSTLVVNASSPGLGELGAGHGALDPYIALASIQVLQNLLYFAAAYYFGNSAWSSARARELLEERTRELQAERERSQRQAVVLERIRIARELHDVVAHHVSVMGVQAGAARRVLAKVDSDSDGELLDKAVTAVAAIEENARVAVNDLHHLLGALRQSAPPLTLDDASSLGVPQLEALIDETRLLGTEVDFWVVGTPGALSPATSLNVYRIAQEALTNARKHAGPAARVDARLRYLDGAVEIEVSDNGRGGGSRPGANPDVEPGGLGQLGMRERVDAAGGVLEAGPRARGGYVVRARFPVTPARVPQ